MIINRASLLGSEYGAYRGALLELFQTRGKQGKRPNRIYVTEIGGKRRLVTAVFGIERAIRIFEASCKAGYPILAN